MSLENYLAEADRCSQCSYCKWIPFDQIKSLRFAKNCPSITRFNFNSYSARGRYAVSRSLLKGQSDITEMVQHIAFTCLTCGACDVSCKVCRYNLEPLDMVRELKFDLVAKGFGLQAHKEIADFLAKEHNTMMQPKSDRGRWADNLDVPRVPTEACDVLFFAGCRYSFDKDLQTAATSAVKLLQQAGIHVGIMGDGEMCCGSRIYGMGYKDAYARLAAANTNAWTKAGISTIVTACADCYYAFKRLYPQMDKQFKVLHITEYIHQLILEKKLTFTKELPMTVTYHDPCHLGRQGEPYVPWQGKEKKIKAQIIVYEPNRPRYNGAWGVYEQPRQILTAIPGLDLVEMQRIKEYSWCCGAGGGVREAYPEYSDWTATERLEEACATGAEAIVSACPWCERNFMDAAHKNSNPIKVFDIIDLVCQAL